MLQMKVDAQGLRWGDVDDEARTNATQINNLHTLMTIGSRAAFAEANKVAAERRSVEVCMLYCAISISDDCVKSQQRPERRLRSVMFRVSNGLEKVNDWTCEVDHQKRSIVAADRKSNDGKWQS